MKKYCPRIKFAVTITLPLFFLFSACCELSNSCQDACEENNSATLMIENTSNGTLQLFLNRSGRISVNGPGDIDVPAGEMIDYEIDAGFHNIKARVLSCTTNGGRTSCASNGKGERDIDIDACEVKSLVY